MNVIITVAVGNRLKNPGREKSSEQPDNRRKRFRMRNSVCLRNERIGS